MSKDHSNINVNDKEIKPSTPKLVSLSELFQYADKKDKLLMLLGTLTALATGLSQPLQIVIFGDIIDAFNPSSGKTQEENQASINKVTLNFVWLAIGVLICGFGQVTCWSITASRQAKRLRHSYVTSILRQEIGWFDVNHPLQLASKVANTTVIIEEGMGRKVGDGLQFFSMAVSGISIGLIKGWQLALALIAFTPLIALTAFIMMKTLAAAIQGGTSAYGKAGGIAEETLGNIRTVHSFNSINNITKKYENALNDTEKAGIKKGLAVGFGTGVMFFVIYCTYSFGMYYGTTLIINDRKSNCKGDSCFSGGKVLTVFFCIIMGAMALGQAGPSLQAIFSARAAAVDVFEVIKRKSKINPFDTNGEKLNKLMGNIKIENINFRYPSRPEIDICNNYNLSIKSGEKIALVGPSGSGKSTIISLIERFYDPLNGTVYIDDKDIKNYNVKWLREQIGLVGQEPSLFATSIGENIGYGKENATKKEIEDAAKMANAYDFIINFPNGFETQVGERGVQLSGGQKQRIAIARAIIKDPSILLLDEATSALDTESERIVQESLDRLLTLKKRTTIIVAHRLSTIKDADRIAVHSNGYIIELGTHDELMNIDNGHYKQLYSTQQKYQEKDTIKSLINNNELIDSKETTSINEISMNNTENDKFSSTKMNKVIQIENIKTSDNLKDVDINANANINKDDDKEEKEKILYKVPLSRLWKLSWPEKYYFIIGGFGAIVNGATFPIWAILLSKITVLFFKSIPIEDTRNEARWWSIGFALLGLVFCISVILQNYGFSVISERLTKRIRILAFNSMIKQDISWFDKDENSPGSLTTRLATDSAMLQTMTSDMLNRLLTSLATLGIAFGIAFYFSWEMTLIMIAVFPILGFASYIQAQVIQGTNGSKVTNDGDIQAGSLLSESIGSMRTVSSFCLEHSISNKYATCLELSKETDVRTGIFAGTAFGTSQGVTYANLAFLFWFGGELVTKGRITFEEMFTVLMTIMLSSLGIGIATQGMTDAKKAKKSVSSVFSIIDRIPHINAISNEGIIIDKFEGNIEFQNIKFSYPSRPNAIIYKNYSLKIEKGKTVALVGISGSGKSTAISLLERFYDPLEGNILLDGVPINKLNISWLRDHISLVSQEPVLFSGTIGENIQYGKENATQEEIENAAKLANAHDFIMNFPQKYNTSVGDRGIQVSGGQKQRIAIARAIIRDPEVLLLDEATSALDNESERIVQESLDKLLKIRTRTTIVIAHRLSTIRNADLIAVTHDGAIVEKGKHDELINISNGFYRNLVSKKEENGMNELK